jgi:hypothetical protein
MECIICKKDCSDFKQRGYWYGFGPKCFRSLKGVLALSDEGREKIESKEIILDEEFKAFHKFYEKLDNHSQTTIEQMKDLYLKKDNNHKVNNFFIKHKRYVIYMFQIHTILQNFDGNDKKLTKNGELYLEKERMIHSMALAMDRIAHNKNDSPELRAIFRTMFPNNIVKV